MLEALLALNLHEGLFALAKEKAIDAYRNVRMHVCADFYDVGGGIEVSRVVCVLYVFMVMGMWGH